MKDVKQTKLKAVIFDVDGTLVDSNDLHVEAWQVAFRKYGKQIGYDAIHEQIGKGGDQLMPEFLSYDELQRFGKELEEYRVELFADKYLDRVKPFPKVRELFERVKADGLSTALASSAKTDEIERYEKMLGITELVDTATSADDAKKSKPSPDIFHVALDRLTGVDASETIVVGDSPWDVIAASKAGMSTIALLSGKFTEAKLRSAGAAEIYKDISDLLERYEQSRLGKRQ